MTGAGRPRRYDRQSCRQRDYEARLVAGRHGLSDDDVVVSRQQLQVLHDRIFTVEAALDDIEGDLARSRSASAYRVALDHLVLACAELRGFTLEPRTLRAARPR